MMIKYTAKIISRTTYSIEFEVYYERNIPTEEELIAIQTELGYNPAGYGGPNDIRCYASHCIRWTCYGNCE